MTELREKGLLVEGRRGSQDGRLPPTPTLTFYGSVPDGSTPVRDGGRGGSKPFSVLRTSGPFEDMDE